MSIITCMAVRLPLWARQLSFRRLWDSDMLPRSEIHALLGL